MNRIPKHCGVCLIAIALLSGCTHSAQHVDLPGSGTAYEKQFLTWFVRYHQDRDRFIQPCAQKSGIREELRTFCAQADRQHTERIERMRTWLSTWYQTELPQPEPYPLWVSGLQGTEFEREFLKEYLEHHDEGIEQTAKCAAKAVHPELRDLCARINPGQKKTGEQLKRWRCEWFKDCG
jgi:uncharacterized protein (DUF305 family)